jgi:hypothetical protein
VSHAGGSFATSRTFSPNVNGTIGGALSANYKYWIIEAGGTYEIASWNSHGGRYATPDTQLELLAGGRYSYVGWRALQVDYAQGAGVERYELDVLQQGR